MKGVGLCVLFVAAVLAIAAAACGPAMMAVLAVDKVAQRDHTPSGCTRCFPLGGRS